MARKKITFTIDEDTDRMIRSIQVHLIGTTQKGWSYSKVLEILIRQGLKTDIKRLYKKNRLP